MITSHVLPRSPNLHSEGVKIWRNTGFLSLSTITSIWDPATPICDVCRMIAGGFASSSKTKTTLAPLPSPVRSVVAAVDWATVAIPMGSIRMELIRIRFTIRMESSPTARNSMAEEGARRLPGSRSHCGLEEAVDDRAIHDEPDRAELLAVES